MPNIGRAVRAGARILRDPKEVQAALEATRKFAGRSGRVVAEKMNPAELAAAAKKIGTSVQNVIKAEKALAGSVGRATKYGIKAAEERSAAIAMRGRELTSSSRRNIQGIASELKREAGKAYQAIKDAAAVGKKAPSGAVKTASVKTGYPTYVVEQAVERVVKRGTAPAVVAASLSGRKGEEPRQGYKYGGIVAKKSMKKKGC